MLDAQDADVRPSTGPKVLSSSSLSFCSVRDRRCPSPTRRRRQPDERDQWSGRLDPVPQGLEHVGEDDHSRVEGQGPRCVTRVATTIRPTVLRGLYSSWERVAHSGLAPINSRPSMLRRHTSMRATKRGPLTETVASASPSPIGSWA